ncbi:MAG: tagatose 6-phosphate kinase [Thermosipho sp. (in: thermotogales)]|jgi:tagatose 6-phosphate kinase|nr:tagatose 6-phosphate kinase [Thermosipho sp. (in: thermotogales)]
MILTVTLNPSVDRSYRVDNFQVGKIFRAQEENSVAGGKGINVTKVIRALGEEVTATGFLGGKSGEFIEEELNKIGVNCSFIKIEGETRTCIAILDPVLKTHTEILENGPNVSQKYLEEFLDNFSELSQKCDIITASGSASRGVPEDIYVTLINIAKRNGAKLILDTSGNYLLKAVTAKPFMIKPNKEELEKILSKKLRNIEEVKKAALELRDSGIEIVSISLGGEGSIIACEEGVFKVIPPKVKVASPVGSGDSYVAGMAVGIKRGLDIVNAAILATACGAANAMYYKTGYVTIEDVEYIKNKVVVK